MWLETKDNQPYRLRSLAPEDCAALLRYLESLSGDTKRRFAPHAFDPRSIEDICNQPDPHFRYYVAELTDGQLVAYMLARLGLMDYEQTRLAGYSIYPDPGYTASFAPSVADQWQGTGIGSATYGYIEKDLRLAGIRQIMLMGGVQSDNQTAVKYYEKLGFEKLGGFWYESVYNEDMIRWLR